MSQLDISSVIVQWLRDQPFTPQPRIVQGSPTLPPAAYPCISVVVGEARFTNAGTNGALSCAIRVECAAGRPADAQAQARSLALQVRRALHLSHGLAGAVKHIRTEGISYSQRETAGGPVTAVAELALVALGAE
jgi:hypothetical protein